MIYLDTSVALASIFGEPRRPQDAFWKGEFVSSRLLQYEIWTVLHARDTGRHRHERARRVLRSVRLVEMTPDVLVRALRPFDITVRTLDSLHLATMLFFSARGEPVSLASYDQRLLAAARAEGIAIAALSTDSTGDALPNAIT